MVCFLFLLLHILGISGLETSEEGGPLSVTNFPCAGEHACSHCTATFPTRELAEKHELLHSPNQLLVSVP